MGWTEGHQPTVDATNDECRGALVAAGPVKRWYSPRTTTKRKLAPLSYVSKEDAIERRLLTYFTGIHCPKGHLAARYVHDEKCVHCERSKAKAPYVGSKAYKRLI